MKTSNVILTIVLSLLVYNVFSFTTGNRSVNNAVNQFEKLDEQSISLSTGVTLSYVESGNRQGTTIIFLHGFTDSWRSYEKVIPLLPTDLHTISITHRGHGNSSKPEAGYAIKDFAGDVAAFIKSKGLGPCIIVGHSLGGLITQQFALDHPDLTKAIVIVSSDAGFGNNPGLPEFRDEINKLRGSVDYAFADAFQKSTIVKPVDSAYIVQCVNESMKVPLRVWKDIINEIIKVDFSNQLYKINVPALILWGSKDLICSLDDQKLMKEKIKNSTLHIYEGTGHALHWEDPERFADDIVKFVNSLK